MYNASEQFAEINKVGYDNAVKLASLSLEKAERLTKLNLQAAKLGLEQGVYSANAVAARTWGSWRFAPSDGSRHAKRAGLFARCVPAPVRAS
jgi:hypothetical protein